MKKQVLGILAALFVFAVLLPAGAYAAADNVYAILYDDGTLVFQHGDTPEPGKTVTNTYAVDLNALYDYNSQPWRNERESIRIVNFKDKISPTSTAYWFDYCLKLERVNNIRNLNTDNVTNMSHMFGNCIGLTSLDVSNFHTANVTNMSGMFYGCGKLTALDVSHFDTANVVNMSWMFTYCDRLQSLDVSHFNTANVTDMHYMFACRELKVLDVSHFDTIKVTNMAGMFGGCSNLTALDVSHFYTANVTDMSFMFGGCMTALDVSHFYTANVTSMRGMFSSCRNLMTLDVSHFNTANVTDMYAMFRDCNSLTALDLSHFDTANVTEMGDMFLGCSGLTALDVSCFDTINVTDMRFMFYGCNHLKTIYVSDKFTTVSISEGEYTGSDHMFFDCTSLIGGNSTKYDESHTNKEYARIDTASAPGYFTDKNAPAPVTYAITAVRPYNGNLFVTLTKPDVVTVAVSYFDANGQFVSANAQDVPADIATVTSAVPANAKTARVMLFDTVWRPLCGAFEAGL